MCTGGCTAVRPMNEEKKRGEIKGEEGKIKVE